MVATAQDALRVINEIAQDSSKIRLTKHARERMKERNITFTQVLCCFEHGHIVEGPTLTSHGDYNVKITVTSAGEQITTVAALCHDDNTGNYSVIITTF